MPTPPPGLGRNDISPFCAKGTTRVFRSPEDDVESVESVQSTAVGSDEAQKEYAAFVKELLDAEEKRTGGLESRALTVIAGSGTLVTLLLALAALATRADKFQIPAAAVFPAAFAACAFVAAALCAILANAPWPAWGLRPACLTDQLWKNWPGEKHQAVAKVAATRLRLWSEAHVLSQRKARFLFVAVAFQALATLALAISVVAILAHL
ncbi:hypothetical protein J5X84_30515 [Streptosporangiaceae bacterium NEAU-GS5]|nr:hypothetical protein [Streptosporangiaceae bacterium NEAU-GS5]